MLQNLETSLIEICNYTYHICNQLCYVLCAGEDMERSKTRENAHNKISLNCSWSFYALCPLKFHLEFTI